MPITNGFKYQRLSKEEQARRRILGRLTGVIADTTNPTRNGRLYDKELWLKTLNSDLFKEKIQNRCVIGELCHPEGREETNLTLAAVALAEMPKMMQDGKIYGVFDILDTPSGQILKALCDYGTTVGISSRGTGDLITDYSGNEKVDPDSYNLECWDVVLVPAVKEARLRYVTESLDKKRYNKTLRQTLTESYNKCDSANKASMDKVFNGLGIDLSEGVNKMKKKKLVEEDEMVPEEVTNTPEEASNTVSVAIGGTLTSGDVDDGGEELNSIEGSIRDMFSSVGASNVNFCTSIDSNEYGGMDAECDLYGLADVDSSKVEELRNACQNGEDVIAYTMATKGGEANESLTEADEEEMPEEDDSLETTEPDLSDVEEDDIDYDEDDDNGDGKVDSDDLEMENGIEGQEVIDKLNEVEVGTPVMVQMTSGTPAELTLYAGTKEIQGQPSYMFFNDKGSADGTFGAGEKWITGDNGFKVDFDNIDQTKADELASKFQPEDTGEETAPEDVPDDRGDAEEVDFDEPGQELEDTGDMSFDERPEEEMPAEEEQPEEVGESLEEDAEEDGMLADAKPEEDDDSVELADKAEDAGWLAGYIAQFVSGDVLSAFKNGMEEAENDTAEDMGVEGDDEDIEEGFDANGNPTPDQNVNGQQLQQSANPQTAVPTQPMNNQSVPQANAQVPTQQQPLTASMHKKKGKKLTEMEEDKPWRKDWSKYRSLCDGYIDEHREEEIEKAEDLLGRRIEREWGRYGGLMELPTEIKNEYYRAWKKKNNISDNGPQLTYASHNPASNPNNDPDGDYFRESINEALADVLAEQYKDELTEGVGDAIVKGAQTTQKVTKSLQSIISSLKSIPGIGDLAEGSKEVQLLNTIVNGLNSVSNSIVSGNDIKTALAELKNNKGNNSTQDLVNMGQEVYDKKKQIVLNQRTVGAVLNLMKGLSDSAERMGHNDIAKAIMKAKDYINNAFTDMGTWNGTTKWGNAETEDQGRNTEAQVAKADDANQNKKASSTNRAAGNSLGGQKLVTASFHNHDGSSLAEGLYKKRTDYTVTIQKVEPGTKVYNKLEKANYVTDENRCYVITGTVGEQWPVNAKTLAKYEIDGDVDSGEPVKAHPKPSGEVLSVEFAQEPQSVKTSWGDVLQAKVGDAIASELNDDGTPDPSRRRVIDQGVFKTTYQPADGNVDDEAAKLNVEGGKATNEAVNGRSKGKEIVENLKKALKQNKKLKEENRNLKEKLSVSHSKETKLNEEVARYKQAASRLSEMAKEVKPLKENLGKLNRALTESKEASRKSLNESMEAKSTLNERLTKAKAKLKDTNQKLEKSSKLAESYKANYNAVKRELIRTKANLYGVSEDELEAQLGSSFKISDIDRICESLMMVKGNMRKLNINLGESVKLSKNMKVKTARESSNTNPDDISDLSRYDDLF